MVGAQKIIWESYESDQQIWNGNRGREGEGEDFGGVRERI